MWLIFQIWLTLLLAFLVVCIVAGKKDKLSPEFAWQFRLAAAMRTPILVLLVVPCSFLLRCMAHMSAVQRRKDRSGKSPAQVEAEHKSRVDVVVEAVKSGRAAGKKLRTARSSWAQMSVKLNDTNKKECGRVPTKHLNHILSVDTDAMTVTAEPFVTMGQLVEELSQKGLALRCLIEMDSITIGGVALGFGIETNSHRVGFFQETVTAYEMVTGDGQIRHVTADSDAELFYALPWSMGCLGFCTAVTAEIVVAKPFVHVQYIAVKSPKDLTRILEECAYKDDDDKTKPDFIEATVYSKTASMIQLGTFKDSPTDPSSRVNHINTWYKPFYFRWVEELLGRYISNPANSAADVCYDEFIPTVHYYDRFSRSIFWELEDMIPFANHPVYRFLWGWMGAPEVSLLKVAQGPVIRKASLYAHAVQESIVPLSKTGEGVELFDEWFGVYPLLVFPARVYDRGDKSGFVSPRGHTLPGKDYGIFVDIGVYGVPRVVKEGGVWDAKKNCREMEHWTRDQGGFEATYTDLFCTRREYRAMFDHGLFDAVRSRLGTQDVFPEPYDKVRTEAGLMDLSAELAAEAADDDAAEQRQNDDDDDGDDGDVEIDMSASMATVEGWEKVEATG